MVRIWDKRRLEAIPSEGLPERRYRSFDVTGLRELTFVGIAQARAELINRLFRPLLDRLEQEGMIASQSEIEAYWAFANSVGDPKVQKVWIVDPEVTDKQRGMNADFVSEGGIHGVNVYNDALNPTPGGGGRNAFVSADDSLELQLQTILHEMGHPFLSPSDPDALQSIEEERVLRAIGVLYSALNPDSEVDLPAGPGAKRAEEILHPDFAVWDEDRGWILADDSPENFFRFFAGSRAPAGFSWTSPSR